MKFVGESNSEKQEASNKTNEIARVPAKTENAKRDIDIDEAVAILQLLPSHMPISDSISKFNGVWYDSHKQHMIGWTVDQDGPGNYNRKNRIGVFARPTIILTPIQQ